MKMRDCPSECGTVDKWQLRYQIIIIAIPHLFVKIPIPIAFVGSVFYAPKIEAQHCISVLPLDIMVYCHG